MSESLSLEVKEKIPNDPEWVFDASIPEKDRTRYTSDIIAAFKTVFDPEIPSDVYELGLIYKVDIDEHRLIRITMTLTAPGCPVAEEITRSIETAVGTVPGTLGVIVTIVFEPAWDQSRMSDEARVSLDMF
jgi:FeS assembly SUF system protein